MDFHRFFWCFLQFFRFPSFHKNLDFLTLCRRRAEIFAADAAILCVSFAHGCSTTSAWWGAFVRGFDVLRGWWRLPCNLYSRHMSFADTDVIVIDTSTSFKYVNVESNNLLGYASCWIQQPVAPGVLEVVGSNNMGAWGSVNVVYFTVYFHRGGPRRQAKPAYLVNSLFFYQQA